VEQNGGDDIGGKNNNIGWNGMGGNMVEIRYRMKWWWKSWYGAN
jgi:hypothetical protein